MLGTAWKHLCSVQNPCWLMISWGIILPSILGMIIIQERGIPITQPGFNGIIEGFLNTAHVNSAW